MVKNGSLGCFGCLPLIRFYTTMISCFVAPTIITTIWLVIPTDLTLVYYFVKLPLYAIFIAWYFANILEESLEIAKTNRQKYQIIWFTCWISVFPLLMYAFVKLDTYALPLSCFVVYMLAFIFTVKLFFYNDIMHMVRVAALGIFQIGTCCSVFLILYLIKIYLLPALYTF